MLNIRIQIITVIYVLLYAALGYPNGLSVTKLSATKSPTLILSSEPESTLLKRSQSTSSLQADSGHQVCVCTNK